MNGADPVIAYREYLNRDLKLATCTAGCDTDSPTFVEDHCR
jgi:hypothetical protein